MANVAVSLANSGGGGLIHHHFLLMRSKLPYQPPALWILLTRLLVPIGQVCGDLPKGGNVQGYWYVFGGALKLPASGMLREQSDKAGVLLGEDASTRSSLRLVEQRGGFAGAGGTC